MNPRKLALARLFRRLRLDRVLLRQQQRHLSPYVRAVNYHDVPPSSAGKFEAQLQFYVGEFELVGPRELRDLLSGTWEAPRPGILLSFDDGLRSHSEVVAPLLDRYGMTGWFMVPGGFVSAPIEEQESFAQQRSIRHAEFDYGDARLAMTWDQLRMLSHRHVVGCHTWTHRRLSTNLSREQLRHEIQTARSRMEDELKSDVRAFAWVGGEEASYSRVAAEQIASAGYEWSFMTNTYPIRPRSDPLWLQRTNIEASDPIDVVRFQLSGVMDALYTLKRHRIVERLSAR